MPVKKVDLNEFKKLLPELDNEEGWEMPLEIDEYWKPKIGEEVRGIFLDNISRSKDVIDHGVAKKRYYNIIAILTNDGIIGISQTEVLKQRLENVEPGMGVRIKFTGTQSGKGGYTYNTYVVAIKKMGAAASKPAKHEDYDPQEDVEAKEKLDLIRQQLKAGKGTYTVEDIISLATEAAESPEDEDFTPDLLTRVKAVLAKEMKEKKE